MPAAEPTVPSRPLTRLAGALWLVGLLACAPLNPAPAPTPPLPTPAAAAAAEPTALPASIHWSRDSAEHRAIFVQTFRAAAERLEELVAGRDPWTWAVALDGDETILDNSPYQKERAEQGLGFTSESWNAWVRREAAPALPGARDFLETVRRLGGRIAVVTNRDQAVCTETEDNLRQERLPYDLVLCKPPVGGSEKEPRWQAVERGTASRRVPPLPIVLYVGDNINDFPGASQELRHGTPQELSHFGDDWFMLPNTMYGSWERNPAE